MDYLRTAAHCGHNLSRLHRPHVHPWAFIQPHLIATNIPTAIRAPALLRGYDLPNYPSSHPLRRSAYEQLPINDNPTNHLYGFITKLTNTSGDTPC